MEYTFLNIQKSYAQDTMYFMPSRKPASHAI